MDQEIGPTHPAMMHDRRERAQNGVSLLGEAHVRKESSSTLSYDRVRKGQEDRKLIKSYLEAIGSPESHSFPFPFELTAWDLFTRADSMGSPLSFLFYYC